MIVDFAIRDNRNAAVLVLSTPDGTLVEPGTVGQLVGGEAFVVGYDGRAYVTGLASEEYDHGGDDVRRVARGDLRFPAEGRRAGCHPGGLWPRGARTSIGDGNEDRVRIDTGRRRRLRRDAAIHRE